MSGYEGIFKVRPKDAVSRSGVIVNISEVTFGSGFNPMGYLSSSTSTLQLGPILERFLENHTIHGFMRCGLVNLRHALQFQFVEKIRGTFRVPRLIPYGVVGDSGIIRCLDTDEGNQSRTH